MATIGTSTLVQAGAGSTGDKRELAATRGGVGQFFSIDPTGDQTNWPLNDPESGVADELCEVVPVK